LNFDEYKAEDFLLDETFQRFCIGTDQIAIDFWSNWLRKHPEKLIEISQAKELYLLLNGNHTAESFQKDKIAMSKLIEEYLLHEQTNICAKKKHRLAGKSNIENMIA
jgi:hypothetical protein